MNVLQMNFVDVFATVLNVNTRIWTRIVTLGLTLNAVDLLDSSYVVEDDQIPEILGLQLTPDSTRMRKQSADIVSPRLRRGKRPVVKEEEKDEEEEIDNEEDQNKDVDLQTQEDIGRLEEMPTLGPPPSQLISGSFTLIASKWNVATIFTQE